MYVHLCVLRNEGRILLHWNEEPGAAGALPRGWRTSLALLHRQRLGRNSVFCRGSLSSNHWLQRPPQLTVCVQCSPVSVWRRREQGNEPFLLGNHGEMWHYPRVFPWLICDWWFEVLENVWLSLFLACRAGGEKPILLSTNCDKIVDVESALILGDSRAYQSKWC